MDERTPRARGGTDEAQFTPETAPHAVLLELMALSLGDRAVARDLVERALRDSGRDTLPATGPELVAFVRAHVVRSLTAEIGPRLTLALLDDLLDRLDPQPQSPTSGVRQRRSSPTVSTRNPIAKLDLRPSETPAPAPALALLVVDPDRIGRPALARALLRAGWAVTVVDTPSDLATAQEAGEDFAVALVTETHPLSVPIVQELGRRYPHAFVLVRSGDAHRARERFASLAPGQLELRSSDAPPEELVDAVRRTLGL